MSCTWIWIDWSWHIMAWLFEAPDLRGGWNDQLRPSIPSKHPPYFTCKQQACCSIAHEERTHWRSYNTIPQPAFLQKETQIRGGKRDPRNTKPHIFQLLCSSSGHGLRRQAHGRSFVLRRCQTWSCHMGRTHRFGDPRHEVHPTVEQVVGGPTHLCRVRMTSSRLSEII